VLERTEHVEPGDVEPEFVLTLEVAVRIDREVEDCHAGKHLS
jgi:hypothetical protein